MSGLHDFDDGTRAGARVLLLDELREDTLKVGKTHKAGEIAGRRVGEDFAAGDDDDAAADLLNDLENVRDVEDGFALGSQDFEKVFEETGGDDVETGKRLIENEKFRVVEKRRRDEDALAHALGVRGDGRVFPRLEVQETEQAFGFLLKDRFVETTQAADELEVFKTGEVRVEVRFFRDVAEDAAKGDHIVVNVAAVKENAAVIGTQQAGNDFDCSGFAGAVGAEETDDLAGRDLEADILHGGDAPVASEKTLELEHRQPPATGTDIPYVAFDI